MQRIVIRFSPELARFLQAVLFILPLDTLGSDSNLTRLVSVHGFEVRPTFLPMALLATGSVASASVRTLSTEECAAWQNTAAPGDKGYGTVNRKAAVEPNETKTLHFVLKPAERQLVPVRAVEGAGLKSTLRYGKDPDP